jgi:hypothetical protein
LKSFKLDEDIIHTKLDTAIENIGTREPINSILCKDKSVIIIYSYYGEEFDFIFNESKPNKSQEIHFNLEIQLSIEFIKRKFLNVRTRTIKK